MKKSAVEYEQFWNNRYDQKSYAYGTLPNAFLETSLQDVPPGRILMPADGEGRNGVFAASLGWEVVATDLSVTAKHKALALAAQRGVTLEYIVGDMSTIVLPDESFDAIALVYAHFLAEKIEAIHKKIFTLLKPGGIIILEGFSKSHVPYREKNKAVGGPTDPDMLFSTDMIKNHFSDLFIEQLEEVEVHLNEGAGHIGTGKVIRCIGSKSTNEI